MMILFGSLVKASGFMFLSGLVLSALVPNPSVGHIVLFIISWVCIVVGNALVSFGIVEDGA